MITYDSTKCVECNACIRVCPVSIANCREIADNGMAGIRIDEENCIRCGECLKACATHKARDYTDDTDRFWDDLKHGDDITLIVAPAVKVAFDGYWRHVLQWFRDNGVKKIYDVSLGADICTWAHLEYLKANKNKKIITQPCAAIVNYILKYQNELLPHLSPIQSPMLCTAIYARKYLGDTNKIVALSPCIAKGDEFKATGVISYNVTFEKLRKKFAEKEIDFAGIDVVNNGASTSDTSCFTRYSVFEFDDIQGLVGAIYPKPGGLKENLLLHNKELNIINSEGTNRVYDDLREYAREPEENLPQIFDVLSCSLGCISGPALGTKYSTFYMDAVMHNVEKYTMTQQKKITKFGADTMFSKFSRKLNLKDFIREYEAKPIDNEEPSHTQIQRAFHEMGKFTSSEQNFDCHFCGFPTCYEMAKAICRGINVKENCVQYAKVMNAKYSSQIGNMNNEVRNIANNIDSTANELSGVIEQVQTELFKVENINTVGDHDVRDLENNVKNLTKLSENISNAMKSISKSIEAYSDMTDDISAISKQINLLSINASVEASRAGAAGKGFVVVAAEVGKLAKESQDAVKNAESSNIVIQEAISNIKSLMFGIDDLLAKILEATSTVRENMNSNINISREVDDTLRAAANSAKSINELVKMTNHVISKK